MLDRRKEEQKTEADGMFLLAVINKVQSAPTSSVYCPKSELSQLNLLSFKKSNFFYKSMSKSTYIFLHYFFFFFKLPFFYMDIIKNSGDNSLTHAPMNGNLSTEMCPLCSCTMRIAFVHQIWSLMNSPICQVEHSPFHFIS